MAHAYFIAYSRTSRSAGGSAVDRRVPRRARRQLRQARQLYLCDTTVSPLGLYRSLADELGVRPSHRRGQLWADLKKALVQMVDERGSAPIVVLDVSSHELGTPV